MAEPRRIALETDKNTNVEKKPVEAVTTLRFSLSLSESNERTCPEISYPDLVKNASGDPKEKDPFGLGEEDDHDQLTALARKLEEKYNPGLRMGSKKGKRKKVGKMEDFMDLGMGYDENDSFVDNTEAYDELVPSTLTTQHGGFYINSGELKFRDVNSNSDDDGDIHDPEKKKKVRRKRLAKDGIIDKERRKRRLALGTKDGELIHRKRRIDSLAKSALKPKKKNQPTVANLIQQQEKARQTVLSTVASTSTGPFSNNGSGDSALNGLNIYSLTDDSLSLDSGCKNNMNSSITEAIESVINASLEDIPTEAEAERDGNAKVGSCPAPKLPGSLPSELEVLVQQIKQAAQQSEDGKCKFFTPTVNDMLLTIEMQSRDLICHQRSGLYAHLGAHLPCSKETLMKRAKRLRLDKEDGKLKIPMIKLKEAIGHVMPQLLDKYNLECQTAIQARLSTEKETEDSSEAEYSDSDEEDKPELIVDDKNRKSAPRKRFTWNNDVRALLCDVVKIKMNCFGLTKHRVQTAEEYLRQFLETEVKELWPKGWMQTRILLKQSRVVHAAFTSIFSRPKKLTVVPKKILPTAVLVGPMQVVTAPKLVTITPAVIPSTVTTTKLATMTTSILTPSITTTKLVTMTPAIIPTSITTSKVVTMTPADISSSIATTKVTTMTPAALPSSVTSKLVSSMTPVVTTSTAVTKTVSITATTATTTPVLSTANVSPVFILSPTTSSSNSPANFFRSMLTASYAASVSNTLSTTTITSTSSAISTSMLTSTLGSMPSQPTTLLSRSQPILSTTSLISRSQPILSTTVYATPIVASKNIPSLSPATHSIKITQSPAVSNSSVSKQPLKTTPLASSLVSVSKLPLKSTPPTVSHASVSKQLLKPTLPAVSLASVSKNLPISTQSISISPISLLSTKSCTTTVFTSAVSLSRNSPITTFVTSSTITPRNSPSSLNPLVSSTSRSLLPSEKSAITNTLISNTKITPTTTPSPSSLEYITRLMSGVSYHSVADSFSKLPATANIMRLATSAAQSNISIGSSIHQTQQNTTSHPVTNRTVTNSQDKLLKSKLASQDSLFPKSKNVSSCQDQSSKPKIASSIPSTTSSLLTNMNSYKPEQEKNLTKFLVNKPQQTSSSEGTKLPSHSMKSAATSLSDVVPTVSSQNYVSASSSYLSHNSTPATISPIQHKSPSHTSSGINLGLSSNHATLSDLATQAELVYPAHFQTSPLKTEACQRSSSQGQSSQWGSPIYMTKLNPVSATLPGYQSLSLPDLTKSTNTAVRPHNSHTIPIPSSDAIITGPAPGTFTHGQTKMNSSEPVARTSTPKVNAETANMEMSYIIPS